MAYAIRKLSFFTKQLAGLDEASRTKVNETISIMREDATARDTVNKRRPQFASILQGTGVGAPYMDKILEFTINGRWRIFGYQTDGFDKTHSQPPHRRGKYGAGPEQTVHYDGQVWLIRIGHLERGVLVDPGDSLAF